MDIPTVFPAPPGPKPNPAARPPQGFFTECVLCGAHGVCRPWSGFSSVCRGCERGAPTLPFPEPLDPRPIR